MRCKCLKSVTDKYTGEAYKEGEIYEFSAVRAAEVNATEYFQGVKGKPPKKTEEVEE